MPKDEAPRRPTEEEDALDSAQDELETLYNMAEFTYLEMDAIAPAPWRISFDEEMGHVIDAEGNTVCGMLFDQDPEEPEEERLLEILLLRRLRVLPELAESLRAILSTTDLFTPLPDLSPEDVEAVAATTLAIERASELLEEYDRGDALATENAVGGKPTVDSRLLGPSEGEA